MNFHFTAVSPAVRRWLVGAIIGFSALPAMGQRNPLKSLSPATRQQLLKGQYAQALGEIDQRLRTDSLNVEMLALRAECHLNLKGDPHYALALTDLNKALRLRPNTLLLLSERGYAYYLLRRYPESVADLSAALKQTPAEPALICQRGLALLSDNHLREALTDFAQAASIAPTVPDYGVMLAIGQMVNGRYAEALKTCSLVIDKNKKYSLGYANRALVRQYLKDPAGARQDANEALRVAPTDTTALLVSAVVHQQAGETAAAQQGYDQLQERAKDKSVLFFERGDLYLQLGQIAAAEADWKQAAQLGHPQATGRLAAGFKAPPQ